MIIWIRLNIIQLVLVIYGQFPFQDRVDQLEGQAKDAEMRWLG